VAKQGKVRADVLFVSVPGPLRLALEQTIEIRRDQPQSIVSSPSKIEQRPVDSFRLRGPLGAHQDVSHCVANDAGIGQFLFKEEQETVGWFIRFSGLRLG